MPQKVEAAGIEAGSQKRFLTFQDATGGGHSDRKIRLHSETM